MKISLAWLSQHLVFTHLSLKEFDDLLTFAGVEVEATKATGVPSDLIVVAEITTAEPHPNADRLKVCQVNTGEEKCRTIVCGARNYQVGDRVPCALPGAQLAPDFTIKEGKLRGVVSQGMLCAASEIGLTDTEDGLMILPADSPIGEPLQNLFPCDTQIEIEVTPNRPDLLSHFGLARELGALIQKTPTAIDGEIPPLGTDDDFIQLDAPHACPYYTARRIRGVKVGPSPGWLKQRLESIGLRPINNIVDVTNFILHDLGQPLHTFDASKVDTSGLKIRQARANEPFTSLDDQQLKLSTDDLVIADQAGNALALAGITGGKDSGICEETTDVILESAYFEPVGIRLSARRHNLSTDSSYRFERGVDPAMVNLASTLATQLIIELAGGTADPMILTQGTLPPAPDKVNLDRGGLQQIMGDDITLEQAEDILTRLGLRRTDATEWEIPSYRRDLQRHIDLIEEIARVHGLANITSRFQSAFTSESESDRSYNFQFKLKNQLVSQGFYEIQTIKLIARESTDDTIPQVVDALPLRPLQPGDLISVAKPLSEDHCILRPSLTPGLVACACRNARQGVKSIRLFELGRQFRNAGGGKATDLEADSLALLIAGNTCATTWAKPDPRQLDIFDLKAYIAHLLPKSQIQFKPRDREPFILAGDILANDKPIGCYARIHPARCRQLDLPSETLIAELDLAKLQQLGNLKGLKVSPQPQFPSSSRDAAIDAPCDFPAGDIEKVIRKHPQPLLVESFCFDLFADPTGEKLPKDRKSLAYRFIYRSKEKTLQQDEVDQAHQNLLNELSKKLPINFR